MAEAIVVNPPLTIVIRPAEAADLPALEWGGVYTNQRPVFERTLAEMRAGQKYMLVALAHAEVIGQIFLQFRSAELQFADGATRGYLYALRVRPEWRGHGVGTFLLNAAEAELRQRGFRVAVISAGKDNPRARQLYERLGYHPFTDDPGEWYFTDVNGVLQHVQEACWVLEKALG